MPVYVVKEFVYFWLIYVTNPVLSFYVKKLNPYVIFHINVSQTDRYNIDTGLLGGNIMWRNSTVCSSETLELYLPISPHGITT
jgi:hypothetical protein